MLKRVFAMVLLLGAGVPLAGCVVYTPPPPRPAAHWVPGHYTPWGRWVPGHWA